MQELRRLHQGVGLGVSQVFFFRDHIQVALRIFVKQSHFAPVDQLRPSAILSALVYQTALGKLPSNLGPQVLDAVGPCVNLAHFAPETDFHSTFIYNN
jgi:hypothetical protein